ncbi:MAG: 1-deoxy-D-xylulose-5-phosphate synthase, partial [Lachnospiraceae bacterium]|nr:1-deoxy-D-xylulose-5-phosphate synthase [Lachnospiraceae bacterium]
IRYSRGKAYTEDFDGSHEFTSVVNGKTHYNSRILIDGDEVALIAVGNIVECAAEAVMLLRETGISAKLIDARFVKPVDYDMVNNLANKFKYIFTLEEGIKRGGYGENVNSILTDNNYKRLFRSIAIDDMFVPQGSVAHLRKKLGLDSRQIADFIISNIRNGN